jgi:hypothetical protein
LCAATIAALLIFTEARGMSYMDIQVQLVICTLANLKQLVPLAGIGGHAGME